MINENKSVWTESLDGYHGISEIKVPVDDNPQSRLDEYFDSVGKRIGK